MYLMRLHEIELYKCKLGVIFLKKVNKKRGYTLSTLKKLITTICYSFFQHGIRAFFFAISSSTAENLG